MKNKLLFSILAAVSLALSFSARAENLFKNTARMQAMDKITGRVSVIDVPVDGKVDFGSFSIVVRSCQTRSAEEIPDSFAFVDVADSDLEGKLTNVFRGWMIASSPATNAVEHPIYDVWLLKCLNKKVDKSLLLSEEELEQRNSLPTVKSAEKRKSVAEVIDEMQYQNEQTKKEQSSENKDENMMMEFATDEDSPESEDENLTEEDDAETEDETSVAEDDAETEKTE